MNYPISHIATIIKAAWLQKGADAEIAHLLTDSRKLLFPGSSVFFALHSNSRDGHQYIPGLFQRGVRNFVVSKQIDTSGLPGANLLKVNDTLLALQDLAANHRNEFRIPVIGITGSNGKTIVKEWLNQLLEPDYAVVRSPRSYNSQIGVPLSVWLMEPRHQLGIFEAGISQTGEMTKLEKVIKPTIGVFTNLGSAHDEGFLSAKQKLEEKWLLFKDADFVIYRKGNAIVDALIENSNNTVQPKLLSWGFEKESTVFVEILNRSKDNTHCRVTVTGGSFELMIPFADEASVENAMTCCTTLLCLGLAPEKITERIADLHSVAMRLELKVGINHCSVINDSYSADLSSLAIALEFLSQQQQHAGKTIILSDIPQASVPDPELYQKIAALLKQHGVGRIFAIGPEISRYQDYFFEERIEVQTFLSTEAFIQHFDELVFSDETILVKGARKFSFETISALLELQEHQTVMEIDLNNMVHNLKLFQQQLRSGVKLMAMVKAFSYGSGSFEVANLLQFHRVDYLAVAYTDEGVTLRKAGISLPIMVMNAAASGFNALVECNLEPVLYSLQQYRQFEQYLKQEGYPKFPVHIEVETGMNRLGLSEKELPELLELLKAGHFKVQSVFSHFAASEDPAQDAFSHEQASRFERFCEPVAAMLPYPFLRHIENTSAIVRHPQWQYDMVRLGIGLYGIDPLQKGVAGLKAVSTLKSTIAQIKFLKPGETVGYNRKGIINRPSVIATIRIGYADGYPRALGNGMGKMLVNGRLAPVVGSICMDMTMIDITEIPGVQEGDEVIVFGTGLPVWQVAEWANTIAYEMLSGVSQRVKRIYYQD